MQYTSQSAANAVRTLLPGAAGHAAALATLTDVIREGIYYTCRENNKHLLETVAATLQEIRPIGNDKGECKSRKAEDIALFGLCGAALAALRAARAEAERLLPFVRPDGLRKAPTAEQKTRAGAHADELAAAFARALTDYEAAATAEREAKKAEAQAKRAETLAAKAATPAPAPVAPVASAPLDLSAWVAGLIDRIGTGDADAIAAAKAIAEALAAHTAKAVKPARRKVAKAA